MVPFNLEGDFMMCRNTVDDLISHLYPGIRNLDTAEPNDAYCRYLDCTILAACNDAVDDINHNIPVVRASANGDVLSCGISEQNQPI